MRAKRRVAWKMRSQMWPQKNSTHSPVDMWVCIRACTCKRAVIVLPLQPLRAWGANPCTSHLEHISNKIKIPLPFLSPFPSPCSTSAEAAGFCPRTVCWCTHDTPIYLNLRHRTVKRDPAACDPTSNCLQWNKQLRNVLSGVGQEWRGVRGLTASSPADIETVGLKNRARHLVSAFEFSLNRT